MRTCYVLAAVICLLTPATGIGQFNKCTAKDGKVVYTDGPCPPGTQGPRGAIAAEPSITIPELSWDKQVFGHWCAERWNEVSPRGHADRVAHLYQVAQKGGEQTQQRLRQHGMTVEQAIQAEIDSLARDFNTDCSYFGFKKVGASTDQYNENVSRVLKQTLDTKYPASRQSFERARGR